MDGISIIGRDESILEKVIRRWRQISTPKEYGEASELVGIAIIYDKQQGNSFLNQASAIRRALKKFNMSNCKPISNSMDKSVVALLRSDSLPITYVSYRLAIVSLCCFAACSRPYT